MKEADQAFPGRCDCTVDEEELLRGPAVSAGGEIQSQRFKGALVLIGEEAAVGQCLGKFAFVQP